MGLTRNLQLPTTHNKMGKISQDIDEHELCTLILYYQTVMFKINFTTRKFNMKSPRAKS